MRKKISILAGIMAIILMAIYTTTIYINRNNQESFEAEENHIRIVTSFYPTYVLTINLTDNISDLRVDSLTDFSAGCLHDYQLTTNDMRLLSNADIFIINGGGMEEYLENVIDNYPDLTIINLSKDISMLESEAHHGGDNPHVWLDPELYMIQIENAREALESYIGDRVDRENYNKEAIAQINSNAREYLMEIEELAGDMNLLLEIVKDMFEGRNISNKVVVFHDSFAYISRKAGLEVAYTVEVDDDHPLSAGEIAEIIDAIREEDIPYLFTEEQYDDSISDRIKEETDAKVYIIDSAVTGDASKDSYLKAMRGNIDVLKKAFNY